MFSFDDKEICRQKKFTLFKNLMISDKIVCIIIMKDFLNFKVIITRDEDGVYVASCPAIPGCHSQGDTLEDAEKNIKEARQYRDLIDFGQDKYSDFISLTNVTVPHQ